MYDVNFFDDVCKKNSFNISELELSLLKGFVEQLIGWNKKINLVSRKEEHGVWKDHILGSVSFLFSYNFMANSSVLDLGTGGGLPGIPIAILNPQLNVTLLDSIQKKVSAVQSIIRQLQLENVGVICSRVEDLARKKKFQNVFDYIIVRGVAPIVNILRWGKPLLRNTPQPVMKDDNSIRQTKISKGSIIMLKGGELSQEMNEASKVYPKIKIISYPILIKGIGSNELLDKKIVIAHQ